MKGSSLTHVAGGDAALPPTHVVYGQSKPKQVGLDWSTMRPRFEDESVGVTAQRCWVCKAPADSPDSGQCQKHYDEYRAADRHRQNDPISTTEVPMPTITTTTDDTLEVPGYPADMAEVLASTEAHPDPLVRALRKLAVQAIRSLALASTPKTVPALASRAALPPTPYTSSPKVGADTPAAVIRLWANAQGLDCPKTGRLPESLKEAYALANPEARA